MVADGAALALDMAHLANQLKTKPKRKHKRLFAEYAAITQKLAQFKQDADAISEPLFANELQLWANNLDTTLNNTATTYRLLQYEPKPKKNKGTPTQYTHQTQQGVFNASDLRLLASAHPNTGVGQLWQRMQGIEAKLTLLSAQPTASDAYVKQVKQLYREIGREIEAVTAMHTGTAPPTTSPRDQKFQRYKQKYLIQLQQQQTIINQWVRLAQNDVATPKAKRQLTRDWQRFIKRTAQTPAAFQGLTDGLVPLAQAIKAGRVTLRQPASPVQSQYQPLPVAPAHAASLQQNAGAEADGTAAHAYGNSPLGFSGDAVGAAAGAPLPSGYQNAPADRRDEAPQAADASVQASDQPLDATTPALRNPASSEPEVPIEHQLAALETELAAQSSMPAQQQSPLTADDAAELAALTSAMHADASAVNDAPTATEQAAQLAALEQQATEAQAANMQTQQERQHAQSASRWIKRHEEQHRLKLTHIKSSTHPQHIERWVQNRITRLQTAKIEIDNQGDYGPPQRVAMGAAILRLQACQADFDKIKNKSLGAQNRAMKKILATHKVSQFIQPARLLQTQQTARATPPKPLPRVPGAVAGPSVDPAPPPTAMSASASSNNKAGAGQIIEDDDIDEELDDEFDPTQPRPQ